METLQIQHSDESVEFLFTNLDVIEIVSETQHVLVDVRGRGNEALLYLMDKGVNVRSVSASPPTVEPGYTRLGLPASWAARSCHRTELEQGRHQVQSYRD